MDWHWIATLCLRDLVAICRLEPQTRHIQQNLPSLHPLAELIVAAQDRMTYRTLIATIAN